VPERPRIVAYDELWTDEFDRIAARLVAAFGELAVRIDHIGSTSVPGLAAKDVIDVQVSVSSLGTREPILAALSAAGLSVREDIVGDHHPPGADGPDEDWRKVYASADEPRAVHVHVREVGRANQRYALLFRDYLRTHPDAAEAYRRAKLALAALCADTMTYADAKDPVCDLIVVAAEGWATETAWTP
jgi:GrpB-like predicted nucleotidyltransferase (UPF0157 family)